MQCQRPMKVRFSVLLEDDQLITELCIKSERLLEAPLPDEKETDILLTIDAIVKFNQHAPTKGWIAGTSSY
jgi:hypothetical protein